MPKGQTSPVLRYLRQVATAPSTAGQVDAQLLERFVARGDQDAFAALVQRHGPMVLSLCRRRLHNLHDAEDAFQATFLVLARKAATLRQRSSVGPWLYGVACRIALKARARMLRWQALERPLVDLPALEPLSELAWRELRLVLDEEIQRLPERYRAAVVLCYLEGQTYVEAARHLGCPPGTVAGRLARAREMLRRRLLRRGFPLSAGLLGGLLTANAAPAAIPLVLVHSTVAMAASSATGQVAAAAVSARVAALAEGVHKAMLWTRLTGTTAVLLLVGLAGTGTFVYRAQADGPGSGSGAPPRGRAGGVSAQDDAVRLKKQVDGIRRELDQLIRLEQQQHALARIEEGIKLLKQTTRANAEGKVAVDDFARAFKKLQGKLRKKPARSDKEALRKKFDDWLKEYRKLNDRSLPQRAPGAPGGGPRTGSAPGGFGGMLPGGLPRRPENPGGFQQPRGAPMGGGPGGRGPGFGLLGAAPARRVEGTVQRVSAQGLVQLSIGSDAGLQRGQTLEIYRVQPPVYLGRLLIVGLTARASVGKVVRQQPAQAIKPNDLVTPALTPQR